MQYLLVDAAKDGRTSQWRSLQKAGGLKGECK